ncbi:MAG: AAA family ATPase, partial [Lachnospiraceae bacterium]|nr:AAA family ATPase [Lachnospiraceae bacterium]
MRLISCHIENFGKLSDRTVSFDDISGINVLCENNGWGKSTLADFIKVMFFGFDNEGKRSSVENERQHFKPWQGGVYGGQLTFESGGKRYIISRTFGAKEKDDEFMLQDADTKLEVTNFSKNIGEELFQIDRASFARSAYISQNDCITTTTDRINAKLGNLTDNTDDLNNYETAAKKIADKLNFLSKTRKTGELYKQKEKIAQLKQEIKKGEAIDASMEGILGLKNELNSSYETLKARRSELQGRQKKISEYKDILVKKKEYEQLCDIEAKKRKGYEEKKTLFPVRIPQGEEIDKYVELEYRTSVLKKNLEFSKPEDGEIKQLGLLENRFSEGIPESEDIEETRRKVNDMQTLRWNIEKSMLNEEETNSLKRFEELFA